MSARVTLLEDRQLLEIGGEDGPGFLQGLITNDVESLTEGEARFAALLSPQGKILFDFFVARHGDGFLVDCPGANRADLIKRLTLYRLRAKVTIAETGARVFAAWGESAAEWGKAHASVSFVDPRLPALGIRAFSLAAELRPTASMADYEAHRIGLCVPDGGKDYAYGETFPHDPCLDLLHGVSFKKGCFVGQEVVARMQHRGTARTRVLAVTGAEPLPQGGSSDIVAEGLPVGRLGSAAGAHGIALARIDRVKDAAAKDQSFSVCGIGVDLAVPDWANYSLNAEPSGGAS